MKTTTKLLGLIIATIVLVAIGLTNIYLGLEFAEHGDYKHTIVSWLIVYLVFFGLYKLPVGRDIK